LASIIEVRGLAKEYNKSVRAVNDISFDVHEGEVFGFLGPNGAGKSTTISMITTLLTPTEGTILIDGKDSVKNSDAVRKMIGLVPQDLTSDDDLSGRENLLLQADLYNVPKSVARERSKELLSMVQLDEAADRLVDTYSGGMRKRLELIEGLIHRPKILFLDEPTLGLDVQTRKIIWDYIKKLKEDNNMTVFLTTHYLEEADSLCDRIAIVDEGKIKIIGTPDELKASLGGDKVDVDIHDPVDVTKRLSSLPGVQEVTNNGTIYTIRTTDGDATMCDVLSEATNGKWKIVHADIKRPSMNEVFLRYTGKNLHDNNAESSREDSIRQNAQSRRRKK
jgi:ABC-2 type transport system ATP-binding protein